MSGKSKARKQSQISLVLHRLAKNKAAMLGLCIFVAEILIAIFATRLMPYRFDEANFAERFLTPSMQHLFGTDSSGRDLFSRVLYGARYSLSIGVLAVLGSAALGMLIGSIAGFFGGSVDNLIMRFLDIIQSVPGMLLTIVLASVLGAGYGVTIVALLISTVPARTRLFRAAILNIRGAEYLEAATSINCSQARIILTHIVPNALSPMIVNITMGIANSINMVAGLSFIGLGVPAPIPEWGALLSAGRENMRQYPHLVIFPGLAIMLTVFALNMLGDGLRDAMDPKLKN
ncbi:ABC transporter permease [Hungatella hathewayi]